MFKIMNQTNTEKFLNARNFLLKHRLDYEKVAKEFVWPVFHEFNWAREWFDVYAKNNLSPALWIKHEDQSETKISYADLSHRSNQISCYLQRIGVQRGDKLIVLLSNLVPLWELMLAAIKIGAIIVPTSTLATKSELIDRIQRSGAKFIFTEQACVEKISDDTGIVRVLCQGKEHEYLNYEEGYNENGNYRIVQTKAADPLFLYFTSGTTSLPKLVQHTHQSYPVGHFSTMYWIGIQEGDIHQNISSPGWAKHAWSSFFAPFNAGATVFIYEYTRFNARNELCILNEIGVNTLCVPPTVWRMMILENLEHKPRNLREIVSAGEPLNPEVIQKVKDSWGIQIRDGYGQTETTALLGNCPGQKIKSGSTGRVLPGCSITLLNHDYHEKQEGELALRLNSCPLNLMNGYIDDQEKTNAVMKNGYYRTGDEASIDEDGYFFFFGRRDDVFKSSDYRISPFELENILIEHDFIVEAAVVPSPDKLRTNLPKAFVTLKPGVEKKFETAREILLFAKAKLPPYKRIRKLEFRELPKTISGKIKRIELRKLEAEHVANNLKGEFEFFLSDL